MSEKTNFIDTEINLNLMNSHRSNKLHSFRKTNIENKSVVASIQKLGNLVTHDTSSRPVNKRSQIEPIKFRSNINPQHINLIQ